MADSLILRLHSIEPLLVENRPAFALVSLLNCSGAPINGWITAYLAAGTPAGMVKSSSNWRVAQLAPGALATGAVKIELPAAGKNYSLVLVFRSGQSPSDDVPAMVTSVDPVDISARYRVALESFTPVQTRGRAGDELWGIMTVQSGVRLGSFAHTERIGPVHNANMRIPFPNVFSFFPLDLPPSDETSKGVVLGYVLFNKDTSGDLKIIRRVFNELADIVLGISSAFVPGDTMAIVNDRMHEFHDTIFAGCDGIVASDTLFATGKQLADSTRYYDWWTGEPDYPGQPTDIFCNDRPSRYRVKWIITRHRANDDVLQVKPEFATLKPGKSVTFKAFFKGNEVSASWSVDGDFRIHGTINQGVYVAPGAGDENTLHLVRAVDGAGRVGLAFVRLSVQQQQEVQAEFVDNNRILIPQANSTDQIRRIKP